MSINIVDRILFSLSFPTSPLSDLLLLLRAQSLAVPAFLGTFVFPMRSGLGNGRLSLTLMGGIRAPSVSTRSPDSAMKSGEQPLAIPGAPYESVEKLSLIWLEVLTNIWRRQSNGVTTASYCHPTVTSKSEWLFLEIPATTYDA